MAKRTFNEDSTATFVVRPIDKDNAQFTPTTARYRLDDFQTREELIAWTALVASTEMTITIPASAHVIQRLSRKRERKVLSVQLDNGLTSEANEEHIYWVKNLHFAQVA